MRRIANGVGLLLLATSVVILTAGCQVGGKPYPSKEISIVVPFGAGGPSDLAARYVGDLLSKDLGQPVIVVNRAGGGSAVGLQEVASSKTDGYAIGLTTSSLISNKHIGQARVDYTQMAPLAAMLNSPGSIAVKADSPYKELKDLVSDAKARPGKVRIGNTGTGATWHLMSVMLEDLTSADFVDVPYDGGAQIVAAQLGGHVEAGIQSVSGFTPNVAAGKLRFLGVSADQRDPTAPNAPTFKEQGFDLTYGLWTGFVAPKRVPSEVVSRLSGSFEKISKMPEFTEFAKKNGFGVNFKNPDDFSKLLKAEDERIGNLAKKHNFQTK